MKKNDILKEISKASFKMLAAQDIEGIRLTLKVIIDDMMSFEKICENTFTEEMLVGLKNMRELLDVYSEQLVKQAEKEYIGLAEELGED